MVDLLVTAAEAVAIIFDRRRRHRWSAKSRMTLDVRPPARGDVAARCFDSVMVTLPRDLGIRRRRGRRFICHHLSMTATNKSEGQK